MASQNSKYRNSSVTVSKVHSNLAQEIIEITEDRLRLKLGDHLANVRRQNEWKSALALLLTLAATLLTAKFQTVFGISAQIWKSLFIIAVIFSAFWVVSSIIKAIRAESLDQLVSHIKSE